MELSYKCGEVLAPALLGDAVTHTLTELGYAIVKPIVVSMLMSLLMCKLPAHRARLHGKPVVTRHALYIQSNDAALTSSRQTLGSLHQT